MNNPEKAVLSFGILALGGCVVAGAVEYVKVARIEREKRKRLIVWRDENLACIEQMRQRMFDICNTTPIDHEAFWAAWREEQRFLDIVQNQPPY